MARPTLAPLLLAAAAALTLAVAPALAANDRKAPTTPGSFRVTSTSSYTASLAWQASSDNSGSVSYVLSASTGESVTLPGSTTSYTWHSGLLAGYGYTFTIRAVDPSGNTSRSVSVSTVLPADRTPPTASTLSVTGTGSTHVSLAWTPALDDGPYVTYTLDVSGTEVPIGPSTSYTVTGLAPATTYTITVRARDNWDNLSPPSNAVTVKTLATDPADTTPPTAPGGLTTNGMVFQDGETWLFWTQSTDDLTPQSLITYLVLVNGDPSSVSTVTGRGSTITYVPTGRTSTIEVIAVDEAGNRSAPATISVTP
jgi:chitodextrinase